jgi:SpoVK/Ycf46/Vps4 family AAA+-type ATPase
VFLESRTKDSLDRNELVSIFLRLLEYYRGIMILTTNRSSGIDPAFESRVDITIPYPALSKDAQTRVWRNFFRRMPANEIAIDEQAIQQLLDTPLNGRQVKSAIKMATVLSKREKVPLTIDHLQVCLKIRSQARKVLQEHGGDSYGGDKKWPVPRLVLGVSMGLTALSILWLGRSSWGR